MVISANKRKNPEHKRLRHAVTARILEVLNLFGKNLSSTREKRIRAIMYLPTVRIPLPEKKSPSTAANAQAYVPPRAKLAAKNEQPRGVAPPINCVRDSKNAHRHFNASSEKTYFLTFWAACPLKKLRFSPLLFFSGFSVEVLISKSSFLTHS